MGHMTPLGARRMRKLANFLDKLPRRKWDFGTWVNCTAKKKCPSYECKTKACAVGWLPVVFPSLWRWVEYYPESLHFEPGLSAVRKESERSYDGALLTDPESDAAEFFEISEGDASFLFTEYGSNKETPKSMAKILRNYIETGELHRDW